MQAASCRQHLSSFLTSPCRASRDRTVKSFGRRRPTTICMNDARDLKGLRNLGNRYQVPLYAFVHERTCFSKRVSKGVRRQGVLLDQFGVLHDGSCAYPEAPLAVKWMHEQGLKVLILSNSSKSRTVTHIPCCPLTTLSSLTPYQQLSSKHADNTCPATAMLVPLQGPLMLCSAYSGWALILNGLLGP